MASNDPFSYNEERGFFQRFGLAIGLGAVVLVAGFMVWKLASGGSSAAPHRAQEMVMLAPISSPPPPPPPPPPPNPVQNTVTQQEMTEQPMVAEQATPAEAPAAEAPEGLGTNLTGSGGPDYGLSRSGNGMIGGTGKGTGPGGSRFGSYAAKIQTAIAEALRQNPRTRDAKFSVKMRIWPDSQGRIVRARLAESTGDVAVDRAITEDVLKNLQLEDAPPPGMPTPIIMRLNARRPN